MSLRQSRLQKSMCGLTEKPTNRKSLVCKDWKYKYL